MTMNWVAVNEEYLTYLRDNGDRRIPYSDYGKDKFKPFFGTLFALDGLVYITQISHAEPRHHSLKNNMDFYKIYHPTENRLLSVVNLNYMFPIPPSLIYGLEYGKIDQYRNFKSEEDKSKYIDLLRTELSVIRNLPLEQSARKLYDYKYNKPNEKMSQRCLDYKALEAIAHCYHQQVEKPRKLIPQVYVQL